MRTKMFSKMVKVVAGVLVVTLLNGSLVANVYAADDNAKIQQLLEENGVQQLMNGQFLVTEEEVEVREEPNDSAAVVMTFPEGSTLFVTGEEGEYYTITYQGKTYYAKNNDSVTLEESNTEQIKSEMAEETQEMVNYTDEVLAYQAEKKVSNVWSIVIIVIAAAVFGLGVFSSIRNKKKKAGEKTNEEATEEDKKDDIKEESKVE